MTPLHWAAEEGRVKVVQQLLDASATVDTPDSEGETPLLRAVELGHVEVVELVLAARADVNAQNNQRETALSLAILEDKAEVAQRLLDALADVDMSSHAPGFTALDYAVEEGAPGCIRLLEGGPLRKAAQ